MKIHTDYRFCTDQCCESGMFYSGSGSENLFIPDPDPGPYVLCKKGAAKLNKFFAAYGFRSKF
jgi:hypothetical protein